ncbi:MAG: YggS family pyridoxal phosphate-dependent enzyme [Nitrospirae bacterium]|nr:YggS family pyridoxal phosphate-dependent enzyme [Nitrospirota bacterium]MCL5286205.1 YggS family pyridoxal phosphate-dependent enzyme [Nitrospirota bacterium]
MIAANVGSIRARMEEAARMAGRTSLPRLVGVTKRRSVDEIRRLVQAGVCHLAENRWEEWESKRSLIEASDGPEVSWHFLGTIQSRSLRKYYRPLFRIDSLDSRPHAEILSALSARHGRRQSILLEVNVLREPGRAGFWPEALEEELENLAPLEALDIRGLMVMGPLPEPPGNMERTRRVFGEARDLWDGLRKNWPCLEELSMGMSEDFEEGIRCGATEVRIGRLLFEEGVV